uniref:EGF-like domain-containing protein n=1 Tax=Ciona savignyi TaxID=51511 RepID=H2ZHD2_CIOSA
NQPCDKSNCPPVNNCINETTSEGACCPSCDRLGCRCQGYQYYDCLLNGFVGGLVPEGESYSVDDGSTMCSCPMGGGMILCRYSPHLVPPFCIQTFTRPADGCEECLAVGCVAEDGQKYQGGVNFDRPPCTVCYCPPEGGDILCATDHECQERTKQQLANTGDQSLTKGSLYNIGDMEGGYDTRYLQSDWNKFDSSNPAYQPKGDDGNLGTQNSGSLAAPPLAGSSDASETVAAPGVQQNFGLPQSAPNSHESNQDLSYLPYNPNSFAAQSQHLGPRNSIYNNYAGDLGSKGQNSDTSDLTEVRPDDESPRLNGYLGYPSYLNPHRPSKSPVFTAPPQKLVKSQQPRPVPLQQKQQHRLCDLLRRLPFRLLLQQPRNRPPRLKHQHRLLLLPTPTIKFFVAGSFENVLTACCYQGKQWALDHNSCTGIRVNVKTYSQICAVAQEKCCLEAEEQENCDRGIAAARSMAVCDAPTAIHGQCERDGFKSCCDCCALGLKAYGLSLSSKPHRFGILHSHVRVLITSKPPPHHPTDESIVGRNPCRHRTLPLQVCCLNTFKRQQLAIQSGGRLIRISYSCDDQCKINMWGTDFRQRDLLPAAGKFRSTAFEVGFYQRPRYAVLCIKRAVRLARVALSKRTDAPCFKLYPIFPESSGPRCATSDACDHICTDISSGIQCSCREGYSLEEDGFSCNDINECNLATHTCLVGQICFNTIGSFTCQRLISCGTGYELTDRNTCDDIDECALGFTPCLEEGATCVNTEGSFTCMNRPSLTCTAGYQLNLDGDGCIDVDECESNSHECSTGSTCINEDGSYRCQDPIFCRPGTRPSENQRSCIEVHQCGEGAQCVNVPGSFRCTCNRGYRRTLQNGRTHCEEINECALAAGERCTYRCENTPGSYTCVCPNGYNLVRFDGTCKDIDECASGSHNCSESETCFNTRGGFKCVEITCPEHYARLSNKKRCVRQSCKAARNKRECIRRPKQITYHNISLRNNAAPSTTVFRLSLGKGYPRDRYFFILSKGNKDKLFRLAKRRYKRRKTGIMYTTRRLTGPNDYVVDLTLKLYRKKKWTTFISRLYIFVS